MVFTSDLSVTIPLRAKRGRKKRRKDSDTCLVCGGKSIGINFGVHTCAPCKAFFRRNAVKLGKYEFRCAKDGDCLVTHTTRRLCNCCRLAKCFRVGMDRNAIRTEDECSARQRLVEINREKRAQTAQTIHSVSLLQSSSNALSSNDQTLLTNIYHAYEQTCISLRYDHLAKPSNDQTMSLQNFMNSLSQMYAAFVDYFKLVPEFADLTVNTKISLLKNNFNPVYRLNSVLITHATGTFEDSSLRRIGSAFPEELFSEMSLLTKSFFPFVYDPIFLKLIFLILMFSTSLCTINILDGRSVNTEYLLSVQNFYTELLWRYLLYRCSSYRKAVQMLSSFIAGLLRSQSNYAKLAEFIASKMTNRVDQLEPIMRAMWISENK